MVKVAKICGMDVPVGVWTLFETLSPSDVNTISSSALDVHDLWMVVIDLILTATVEQHLRLRLNGDSGNDYVYLYIDGTTVARTDPDSAISLGSGLDNNPLLGIVYIGGKSKGDDGCVQTLGGITGHPSYFSTGLTGYYNADADITLMTFYMDSDNMTGKIKIYYMDY